jgi:hypothetical protein
MKLEIYKNIYHKKLKTRQLFYCLDLFDQQLLCGIRILKFQINGVTQINIKNYYIKNGNT